MSLQSRNGKLIASGAIDGIINFFDIKTEKLLHTLEGTYIYVSEYLCACALLRFDNHCFESFGMSTCM